MQAAKRNALVCGITDALIVVFVPIVLAAIAGVDVFFILRGDPILVYGFLVPLFLVTGVWGFVDARAHMSGHHRLWKAGFGGALLSAATFVAGQVVGVVSTAMAVEPPFPVLGQSTSAFVVQYSLGVVKDALFVALVGCVIAIGLSALNGFILRRWPS